MKAKITRECSRCEGTGIITKKNSDDKYETSFACKKCFGTGTIKESVEIEIE